MVRTISTQVLYFVGIAIAVLIVSFLINSSYLFRVISLYMLYIALAEATNLIAGYTGYYNFGIATFFGIGAYSTALCINSLGITLGIPIGLLSGAALSAALSLVCLPLFRLHGVFFGMGTMFLNFIIREFVRRQRELGADYGIGVTIPDYNPGLTCAGIFTFGLLVVLFVYVFDNKKIARICEAIRDDELLAQCMGIYTLKYKVLMFAVSAIITGFAGGLFLCLQQFISPETTFDPLWSIQCLNMMLLGGSGTVFGPVLGAIFFQTLNVILVGLRELQMLIFAIITILVVAYAPQGIIGIKSMKKSAKGSEGTRE